MPIAQAAVTDETHFITFPDREFDAENGTFVTPEPHRSDTVELPKYGAWTVTWAAEHPERGWESGTMLVSKLHPARMAHDTVCEILWGRTYTGNYRVVVIP